MDSLQKYIQLCGNAMIHPEMPLLYEVKALQFLNFDWFSSTLDKYVETVYELPENKRQNKGQN